MRRTTILTLGFLLLCGAVAGWMVAGMVPDGVRRLVEGDVQTRTFRLARAADDPSLVTEARWFFLPQLFGDFDLEMDVELAEHMDLDIVLRRLEPRYVDDVIEPFTGRFTVLRLSTGDRDDAGDARAWRTRDEALFGERGGGVGLSAGRLATVWIRARGRALHANVAGKRIGWFAADDAYGMFTMVARGGTAAVHRFVIQPRPMPLWRWSRALWVGLGVLGAALVAAIAAMVSRRAYPGFDRLFSGIVLLLLTWTMTSRTDVDLGLPPVDGMLALLTAALAMATLFAVDLRGWRLLLAVAAVVGFASWALPRHDTSRVDAVFGPEAGAEPAEAHAQLVRGPQGLLDVAHDGPRVFLLGGRPLYDRGDRGDHVALGLQSQLRGRTRSPVEVPCLPTANGWTLAQQWRMYETFYRGFEPEVIVLGIGAGNDEGQDVGAVLRSAHAHCDEAGCQLVLFVDAAASPQAESALSDLAARGVPLVRAADGDPATIAAALADVVAPHLR